MPPRSPFPHALLAAMGLCLASCSEGGAAPTTGPLYYEDVAPILMDACVTCHQSGGIAPFPLISYEDALPVAELIRSQTAARLMPPWPADNSGACNTWKDARWLSQEQIDTIAAWVDHGAPEGDPANAPPGPGAIPGLEGVTQTLDMGIDYMPNSSVADDYRCFVLDPGLTADRFLTGYQVRPGEPLVVHHLILYMLPTAVAEDNAVAKDDAEAGPGYTCYGGAGVPTARWAAAWAPGAGPTYFPEGTGVKLPAGRKVVMQIHYNLAHGALPDRTTVDLRLADTVQKEALITTIAAINLNLPPGQADATASTQIAVPPAAVNGIDIYGHFPHMHTLGRELDVTLTQNGEDQCLLHVDRWNFHWQGLYLYENGPIHADPEAMVNLTCSYDTTSRNDTVTWGEGTGDEMCVDIVYLTP